MATVSIPLWLLFEGYNARLRNWAYFGVPEPPWVAAVAYAWAFATIWPGLFETAALLGAGPLPTPDARPARVPLSRRAPARDGGRRGLRRRAAAPAGRRAAVDLRLRVARLRPAPRPPERAGGASVVSRHAWRAGDRAIRPAGGSSPGSSAASSGSSGTTGRSPSGATSGVPVFPAVGSSRCPSPGISGSRHSPSRSLRCIISSGPWRACPSRPDTDGRRSSDEHAPEQRPPEHQEEDGRPWRRSVRRAPQRRRHRASPRRPPESPRRRRPRRRRRRPGRARRRREPPPRPPDPAGPGLRSSPSACATTSCEASHASGSVGLRREGPPVGERAQILVDQIASSGDTAGDPARPRGAGRRDPARPRLPGGAPTV